MDTRLGYLGGAIAIIVPFCPINNWLQLVLGIIGIASFIIAWFCHGKKSLKNNREKQPMLLKANIKPLKLTPTHISILKVFREYSNELVSVPIIERLTGLEAIIINSTLDDFEQHKLVNATNLDDFNGGWQYKLSSKGIKTAIEFT